MENISTRIDSRIRNLSYSSLLTLHSCPRKFQLYRLNATPEEAEDNSRSVTFAYGHVIGEGIQHILKGKSIQETLWLMYLSWEVDLLAENVKQNKSFWGAILALQQFASRKANGYLEGYELVTYEGKPAVELSFAIHFPDGFKYRGFVDAVLQHRTTKEVLVLEVKTTSMEPVNPAQYKNSAQAIGYSIVLDALFPSLSAYKVLYLVYQTKAEEFVQLPFNKSYYSRALWIRELLLDIETIKLYEEADIYPMHGESCYSFYRECEYLQTCTLSTERLISPLTEAGEKKLEEELAEFQIHITLSDLIEAQINKNSSPNTPTHSNEDELL
jgi:hypothetical protein